MHRGFRHGVVLSLFAPPWLQHSCHAHMLQTWSPEAALFACRLLQRLQVLRLQNCFTQRMGNHVTALSALTELGLSCEFEVSEDDDNPLVRDPTPLALSVLTGLRCMDVQAVALPPGVTDLTGRV